MRLTVTVEPNVSRDHLRHLVPQFKRPKRMVDDPLPNPRMLMCQHEELIETTN
jgi:hypothetical protein